MPSLTEEGHLFKILILERGGKASSFGAEYRTVFQQLSVTGEEVLQVSERSDLEFMVSPILGGVTYLLKKQICSLGMLLYSGFIYHITFKLLILHNLVQLLV